MSIIEFRVAREFDVVKVKRDKSVDDEVAEKVKAQKCLLCGEAYGNAEIVRGNHRNCYNSLMYLCRIGKETEADLMRDGVLLPADGGGRESLAEQLLKERRSRA